MTKQLEFFFDYVSPAAYLAHCRLPEIVKRTGAQLFYRPFLLGAVFKETGNASPISIPAKGAWMVKDLSRFADRYQLPFQLNPHFPFSTLHLMRGAVWIQGSGDLEAYSSSMFRAIWADQRNLGDETEVARILASLDIDPQAFQNAIAQQEIKDQLKSNTDEAIRRGAFGAPTFFVGEEMFWGQDRLDFVEEALKGE